MAYDTNTGSNTLYPRTFYALYIGPNNNGIGHLIFKLSMKQILTTIKYQPVSMPENLFEAIDETHLFYGRQQTLSRDVLLSKNFHCTSNHDLTPCVNYMQVVKFYSFVIF